MRGRASLQRTDIGLYGRRSPGGIWDYAIVKAKVYIETRVIGYLTACPNQDVVIAGHQTITRDWWQTCRERFE